METSQIPVAASPSSTLWKLGLALLVMAIVASTVLSFILAARRVSRVVDADYYRHGLHYGQNRAHNPGCNWTISASLAGSDLQVTVADRSGAPVRGGTLIFESDPLRATTGCSVQLAEAQPGAFRCPRPPSSDGELHGTLRFMRGDASATQKLVLID